MTSSLSSSRPHLASLFPSSSITPIPSLSLSSQDFMLIPNRFSSFILWPFLRTLPAHSSLTSPHAPSTQPQSDNATERYRVRARQTSRGKAGKRCEFQLISISLSASGSCRCITPAPSLFSRDAPNVSRLPRVCLSLSLVHTLATRQTDLPLGSGRRSPCQLSTTTTTTYPSLVPTLTLLCYTETARLLLLSLFSVIELTSHTMCLCVRS